MRVHRPHSILFDHLHVATMPDEKLTSFALRLALTGYVAPPREGDADFLDEAAAAFTPPMPSKKKKPKTAPMLIKTTPKKATISTKVAA